MKRRERVAAKLAAGTTFGAVALEYVNKAEREGSAPATVSKLHWARRWLDPTLGDPPVDQVEPHKLLAVLKKQEASGLTAMCSRSQFARANTSGNERQGSEEAQGEEVTVTASRVQTAVSDVPASISILSGKNLQQQMSVSTDLNDVLTKAVPGLAANNERQFSNGTGPLLRGRPAPVLINGVPVNHLQRSSGFDLGLIDPLAIERIEVNRGLAAGGRPPAAF